MNSKLLQKDVTKILGVSEDCITNWEENRSIPQIQFMPLIIQLLGYLPFSLDQTTLSGKLKAYRHLKGLSQKQLGGILKLIVLQSVAGKKVRAGGIQIGHLIPMLLFVELLKLK